MCIVKNTFRGKFIKVNEKHFYAILYNISKNFIFFIYLFIDKIALSSFLYCFKKKFLKRN